VTHQVPPPPGRAARERRDDARARRPARARSAPLGRASPAATSPHPRRPSRTRAHRGRRDRRTGPSSDSLSTDRIASAQGGRYRSAPCVRPEAWRSPRGKAAAHPVIAIGLLVRSITAAETVAPSLESALKSSGGAARMAAVALRRGCSGYAAGRPPRGLRHGPPAAQSRNHWRRSDVGM